MRNFLDKILMGFAVLTVIILGVVQFVDFQLFEKLAQQAIIGAIWVGLFVVVIRSFSQMFRQK